MQNGKDWKEIYRNYKHQQLQHITYTIGSKSTLI